LNTLKAAFGFTLIELLVVMVILGITSSLVAPNMYSIVKRTQAKTELEKIKAIASLSIEKSFFSASKITITFKANTVEFSQQFNNSVLTTTKSKILRTIKSEYFTFEETRIVVLNGNWQGVTSIKLTKSPDNQLNEFALVDLKHLSNTYIVDDTNVVNDINVIDDAL